MRHQEGGAGLPGQGPAGLGDERASARATDSAAPPERLLAPLGPERRFDLDWVRIGAFLLLMLFHVSCVYSPSDWTVKSRHLHPAVDTLFLLVSPWRLSLLFLLSGIATSYLLARGTLGAFTRTRSVRLLVPLAFGMVVIVPVETWIELVEKAGWSQGYFALWLRYLSADSSLCIGERCLRTPTWNHLWFVAYLWTYSMGAVLLLSLWPRSIASLARRLEPRLSGAGVLLWPIAALALARVALEGAFPLTRNFTHDWYNHLISGGLFFFGLSLARSQPVWQAIVRCRWLALGGALLAYLVMAGPLARPLPGTSTAVLHRALYGADQWLWIVAILGFARVHLHRDLPVRRYLTEAVFPYYIVHHTALIVAAHLVKPLALPALAEASAILFAMVACCALTYELVRRVAPLRPLFGLKWRRSDPPPAAPAEETPPDGTPLPHQLPT